MSTRFAVTFRSAIATLLLSAAFVQSGVAQASSSKTASTPTKSASPPPAPSRFDRKWSKIIGGASESTCKKYLKEEAGLQALLNSSAQSKPADSKTAPPASAKKSSAVAALTPAQAAAQSTTQSAANGDMQSATSTPSPTEQRLLSEGKILRDWPGYPESTVKAFKMILSQAFPPTQMDAKKFVKGFHSLGTCDLQSSLFQAAKDIESHLSTDSSRISTDAQAKLVDDVKSFLHKVAAKPGPLTKLVEALKVTRKLSENNIDPKFSRKYGVIVSLDREAKKLTDKLSIQSSSSSVITIWQRVHDSERLRMELAQILFFP